MKVAFTRLTTIFALSIPLLMPSTGAAAPYKASLSDADRQLIQDVRQSVKDQVASRIEALRAELDAGKISKREYKSRVWEIQSTQNQLLNSLSSKANQRELAGLLGDLKAHPESAEDILSARGSNNHGNGWNYKWFASWISWLREYISNCRIL
ncbi:hypothetical protein [Methylococcus capsulatus]|jgi:hypothetical protein|uniref:hypothetical protein n=1 Tax=Methylococcus capsulatus TaxID=414 RepID=UPI001C527C5A|nr:hypothetical protein [Methylococcus capsulatus]QXP94890.1 hypothetical protein KW113_06940 [Methylococcus capsulatus]